MAATELKAIDDRDDASTGRELPSQRRHSWFSTRACYGGLVVSVIIVSILQIGFTSEVITRLPTDIDYFPGLIFSPYRARSYLSLYPANLFMGQEALEIASASLNLFCGLMVAATLVASSNKAIGTIYALRIAFVIVLAANAVLSFTSFVYSFVKYGTTAHYDQAYTDSLMLTIYDTRSVYDKGTFDLATWACETKDIPGFDDGRLDALCSIGSGARWVTLILFPLSLALCVSVWLDQRGEKLCSPRGRNDGRVGTMITID